MPLTRTEAARLDRLALAALDALRDMDRLAVQYATELHPSTSRSLAADLARATIRRDDTERELLDAIHGMTRPTAPEPMDLSDRQEVTITSPATRRRWTTFLGQ